MESRRCAACARSGCIRVAFSKNGDRRWATQYPGHQLCKRVLVASISSRDAALPGYKHLLQPTEVNTQERFAHARPTSVPPSLDQGQDERAGPTMPPSRLLHGLDFAWFLVSNPPGGDAERAAADGRQVGRGRGARSAREKDGGPLGDSSV